MASTTLTAADLDDTDWKEQVHGCCGLARSLHEAGLIDEYRLLTFPVVVGEGKRLFDGGAPVSGFRLVDSRRTAAGAVYSALTPLPYTSGSTVVIDGKEAMAG